MFLLVPSVEFFLCLRFDLDLDAQDVLPRSWKRFGCCSLADGCAQRRVGAAIEEREFRENVFLVVGCACLYGFVFRPVGVGRVSEVIEG